MQKISLSVLLGFIAFTAGCGDAPTPATTQTGDSSHATSTAQVTDQQANSELPDFQPKRATKTYSDPREVVVDFLQAFRDGRNDHATALLSTGAQEEAWKNGMAITAEQFPQAEFTISEIAYLDENTKSHVMSTWSDVTATGKEKQETCVWILRKEPHGWCISGMASKFLEGVRPVELDFEDQADMQRKIRWAEDQIRRHRLAQQATQRQPVQQANRPATGSTR